MCEEASLQKVLIRNKNCNATADTEDDIVNRDMIPYVFHASQAAQYPTHFALLLFQTIKYRQMNCNMYGFYLFHILFT